MPLGTLAELTKLLTGSRDAVLPSPHLFPPIDLDQLAAELRLVERGSHDGGANLPSEAGANETATESDIRSEIDRRGAAARRDYELQLDLYEARIQRGLLGADLRAQIEAAAQTALSDFRIQVTDDLTHLNALRDESDGYEEEYQEFRRNNRISRPHRKPNTLLRWLIVILAVIVETAANGVFFAKGSALGLIGGIGQALVFSVFNVGIALACGLLALPYLKHVKPSMKLLGCLGVIIYLVASFSLNLMIGHFRDLFMIMNGNVPLSDLRARLFDAPLALADAESVFLVFVGIGLSLVVTADAAGLKDPYPGYGTLGRLRDDSGDEYRGACSYHLEQLTSRRDDAISEMTRVLGELRAKEHDIELALAGRARLREQYDSFLTHLTDVNAGLHQRYREANHRSRTLPPPTRFASPPIAPTFAPVSAHFDFSEDRRSVHQVIDKMEGFIRDLNREYELQAGRYLLRGPTTTSSPSGVALA
jgi:hypothetical protein